AVPCPVGSFAADCEAAFLDEHRKLFGYVHVGRELEIVAARVEARGRSAAPLPPSHRVGRRTPTRSATVETYFDCQLAETAVYDRRDLQPGDQIAGPAIICETASTTVIDPHWQAEVLSGGEVLATHEGHAAAVAVSTEADPVMLEVFNNQFAAIAEQMGI